MIAPYVGNCPISTNQISEYIHKSFSAFSKVTNIDTSVSSMGLQTTVSRFCGFEILLPKKNATVDMTLAHYQTHVKPILENALNSVCCKYERDFLELQNRICFDVMKAELDCRASKDADYFALIYNRLKMEYQMFAYAHYHYLYRLSVISFKDKGEYVLFQVIVSACPSVPY